MTSTVQEAQAYLDGQMAALRKAAPSDNPHPLGCVFSRQWSRGYRETAGAK